jgi:hypothetical protein
MRVQYLCRKLTLTERIDNPALLFYGNPDLTSNYIEFQEYRTVKD